MNYLGIDAGGTWVKAGLFSDNLQLTKDVRVSSGAATGREAYLDSITDAATQLVSADALRSNSVAVGLSLPGKFSHDRSVLEYSPNITGLEVDTEQPLEIQSEFTGRWGMNHVVAENDANCAALGEWHQGSAKGQEETTLLLITWGTGIGTGLVTGGAVQAGWEGGHLPLTWRDTAQAACGCGSKRDLESLIAVPRLVDQARNLLRKGTHRTALTADDFNDERETSRRLLELYEQKDAIAVSVLDSAARWLARGIVTISVLAYPDVVALGGGLMESDELLEAVRSHAKKEARGMAAAAIKPEQVERAALGNEAGIYGAAVLAHQSLKNRGG